MRTALVTGASRGIGRGIALDLARQGFGLTVTSRSASDIAAIAEQMHAAGAPEVRHVGADLADRDALPGIVERHQETFGSMDALVLSGGVGTGGPFESVDMRRIDKSPPR